MFRKIVLAIVFVTLCGGNAWVHAELMLRAFSVDDLSSNIRTASDANLNMKFTPIYGGSDRSAFMLETNQSGRPIATDVSILEFDAPENIQAGDELVGLAITDQRSDISEAGIPPQLLFAGQDSSAAVLPIVGSFDPAEDQMKPFRIPLPAGSASRHLMLTLRIHVFQRAILANLRLVRPGAPTTAPANVGNETSASPLPVGMNENVIRQISGNDFDQHLISWGPASGNVPFKLFGSRGNIGVDVYLPPAQPPRVIPIFSVEEPEVTRPDYAVIGDVTYAGVQGDSDIDGAGYLEMQSEFADGTSTFIRAQADTGPMRLLRGRSGPRPFQLPVHSDKHPTRIRMNLVLPGRGAVSINNLRLVEYAPPVAPVAAATRADSLLFGPRMIWVPVAVLPFFGLVVLLEPMIRRGKGRVIVVGWIWTFFALAQVCFAWSMAAWGHGLPMREVSPALLVSVLILGCALFASRRMSRRYRDVELRKMQLMDAV